MGNRPKLFYGWVVVCACSVGLFLSTGPIVVLAFSLFLKPLAHDFHSGRSAVSFAFTLHNTMGAACLPVIGRLIDRFGGRRVILIGTAMFALGLISAVWLGTSLFYLYLFYTTLGVVSGAASPLPYGVVVSRWFDRHRGLALGLMMVGLGLGGITLPLAAQRLIVLFNWRVAYASFGCAALLLSLPVITVFLNDDPADKGLLPDGDSPQHVKNPKDRIEGMSSREVMHQRTFWLLIGIFFLVGGSVHACVLHMAPLLTDRGVNEETAAAATSLVGLALLVGRIGAGYLLDRFFAPRLAMLLFGGAAAGIALLWVGSTGTLAILAAFFIGLGMGAEADVIAYTISRYFGLRAFGLAYGYGFAAFMLAGALGGFLMGVGFDLTHSYTAPLGVLLLAMATGIGLLTRLGPYRYVPRPVGVPEAGSLAREA